MIIVAGRVYVHLTIDGSELPSSANLVERIVMTEGNGALVPAIHLILNDHSGHLGKDLALTDGNLFVITIGRTVDSVNTVSRQYRLFGHRQVPTAFGPQIHVVATLDAPGYISGSTIESYKGTTSYALLEIAKKSQMCYSGPEDYNGKSCDDSQVWRAVCQSRAALAQKISRHGYIDGSSCMVLETTSLGCLKYRNISDVIETPPDKIKRVFLHSLPNASIDAGKIVYQVRQARDRSSAGLMNSWQNYGSTRYENTLSGTQAAHESVDVKTSGNFLAINSQVSDTVSRSRREYGPLDCGNTHEKHQRAVYQNIKQIGLFSEKLSILVTDVTDVQLLDPVIYRQANAVLTEPVKNSDVYIVVGKSILLKGGITYAERIELARRSLTTKGESELKCADPASDTASITPQPTIDPSSATASTTLPTVRNATAAVSSANAKASTLKETSKEVSNVTKDSMTKLREVLSTVRNYTSTSGIIRAVNNAVPAVGNVLETARTLNQAHREVSRAVTDLTYTASSVKNMSKSMRGSVLGLPGGILDSYSYSLGSVKQLNDHAAVLSTTVKAVNVHRDAIIAEPGGAESIYSLTTSAEQVAAEQAKMGTYVASTWNSSVSLLTDTDIPSKDDLSNTTKYPGGALDKIIDTSYTPLSYSKSSILSANELSISMQKAMTQKSVRGLRNLNWQPLIYTGLFTKAPLTVEQAQAKIEESLADADKALARDNAQGPTWS